MISWKLFSTVWKLCVSSLELFGTVCWVNPWEITFSNYLIRQSFLSLLFHQYPISITILAVISFVTIIQETYNEEFSGQVSHCLYKNDRFETHYIPKVAPNTHSYYVKSILCYEDGKVIQLTKIAEQIFQKFCMHMLIHSLCLGRGAPCSIADYQII